MQKRLMPKPAPTPAVAAVLDKIASEALAQEFQAAEPCVTFTVAGPPVGKPRMTQRDVWAKRPAVLRYREYCDRLRAAAPKFPSAPPAKLEIEFWLPMPESWPAKKKVTMAGQHHRQRSDVDNLAKSIMDALFKEDSTIWKITAEKFWAAPGQERTAIRIWFH